MTQSLQQVEREVAATNDDGGPTATQFGVLSASRYRNTDRPLYELVLEDERVSHRFGDIRFLYIHKSIHEVPAQTKRHCAWLHAASGAIGPSRLTSNIDYLATPDTLRHGR